MMDSSILLLSEVGLVLLVLLLILCFYRVLIGPSAADRLQAIDTITTLLLGIIVMLTIIQRSAWILDIGIALAAFSFIATLALGRYLAEGRVF